MREGGGAIKGDTRGQKPGRWQPVGMRSSKSKMYKSKKGKKKPLGKTQVKRNRLSDKSWPEKN